MRTNTDFSKYSHFVSLTSQQKGKEHTSPIISEFYFYPLLISMVNSNLPFDCLVSYALKSFDMSFLRC